MPANLSESICVVVQGVRRCGKSTLMQQLVARYDLDPLDCAFVNFEDPRLVNHQSWEVLDGIVAAFREARPASERRTFFLDEIQGIDGWQKWLRSQLDRPAGNQFVISGSNATLLSGELASTLTGRHLSVELYPFDLEECRVRDATTTVASYLESGGFPEPLASPDRDRLLRQYFDDIIERDVRERVGARSRQSIRQVAQMVYESAGSELSLRRIAGAAGIAVETAQAYVEGCKDAYMLFECPYFAYSERKRASRNSKYYPIDTGLRRVVVTKTGSDQGKSLECAVFLELKRRYGAVYYWRDKGEVDFVVRLAERVVPVQVTRDEPLPRHEDALAEFYEHFPQADEAVFVNVDNFETALSL